ncbi:MAG: cytochrome c maturation protein CcmE [Gammaproteobacteria bacterium]|nr:cytochrome c maturation protein CcmE [Gammaproteobacteria bacterium]
MIDAIQFSSFSEFLNMGGYAFNVWTVYLLFAIFVSVNLIAPVRKRKQIMQDLKRRVSMSELSESTTSASRERRDSEAVGGELMKPLRRKRLSIVIFIALGLSVGISLVLYALRQNINMFFTPTQVVSGEVASGQKIRIGGMVKEGSVRSVDGSLEVRFIATDYASDVTIHYEGILPDLFREGQGVVVEGLVDTAGVLQASRVLAKHDENYMSQEVKAALDAADVEKPGYENSAEGLSDGT